MNDLRVWTTGISMMQHRNADSRVQHVILDIILSHYKKTMMGAAYADMLPAGVTRDLVQLGVSVHTFERQGALDALSKIATKYNLLE